MKDLLLLAGPIIILYCIASYYEFKKNTIPNIIPILIALAGVISVLIALIFWGDVPSHPSVFDRIIGFIIPFIIFIYTKHKQYNIKYDYLKLIIATGFFFGIYILIFILVICFIIYVIYHTIKKKEIPFTLIMSLVIFLFYILLFYFTVVFPYLPSALFQL